MDSKMVGMRIAEHRRNKNLTQQQLADMLDVTNKAVSKWETGDGYPDITILPRLAKALDTTTDSLLTGNRVKKARSQKWFAIQIFAFLLLFFVALYGSGALPSYLDPASLIFVLGGGATIAFIVWKIRKKEDYLSSLLIFGLPVAGVSSAAYNAFFLMTIPEHSVESALPLVLIPLIYALAISVGVAAGFLLKQRK